MFNNRYKGWVISRRVDRYIATRADIALSAASYTALTDLIDFRND